LEWSTYSSSTKFKSLIVSGNFSTNLLQPNTLLVPSLAVLNPVEDYNFKKSSGQNVYETQIALARPVSSLHSFGIFAHDFEPAGF